jgi:iron complex outermembrane receptor protein
VVTARRRSESLQKVPVAVTALSARDLKTEAVNNVQDLLALTPSLQITTNNADPASSTVSMRGQVQNDIIPAVEPSVGIYVDDVYFGQTVGTSLLHTFNLSRIEVLKGPQGTLYGRNTTSGAIKLYTQDPTDRYEAAIQGGFGNDGRGEADIMANMPLVPGKLDLRVVGQFDHLDGYGTNLTNGDKLGGEDTKAFRGALKFTPTEDIDVILRGEYSNFNNNGGIYKPLYINPALPPSSAAGLDAALEQYGLPILFKGLPAANAVGVGLYQQQEGGSIYDVRYNVPNYTHVTIDGVSLSVADRINDALTLKSITSYRHL